MGEVISNTQQITPPIIGEIEVSLTTKPGNKTTLEVDLIFKAEIEVVIHDVVIGFKVDEDHDRKA